MAIPRCAYSEISSRLFLEICGERATDFLKKIPYARGILSIEVVGMLYRNKGANKSPTPEVEHKSFNFYVPESEKLFEQLADRSRDDT
jgi:tRNA(His) 5'-end guanylyltransferase